MRAIERSRVSAGEREMENCYVWRKTEDLNSLLTRIYVSVKSSSYETVSSLKPKRLIIHIPLFHLNFRDKHFFPAGSISCLQQNCFVYFIIFRHFFFFTFSLFLFCFYDRLLFRRSLIYTQCYVRS